MAGVYNAYVSKCGQLTHTVKEIVANDGDIAKKKSVIALLKRPGLRGDRELFQLKHYLYGYAECPPPGVVIQVVRLVDLPSDACAG